MRGSIYFVTDRINQNIYGGPYYQRPDELKGVKMAAEIQAHCDVDIPTVDFSVPDVAHLRAGMLRAVGLMAEGHDLYVGCMGGIGRTGLFMAGMAKVQDISNPVEFVRHEYYPHAVETDEQRKYISDLDVTAVKFIANLM